MILEFCLQAEVTGTSEVPVTSTSHSLITCPAAPRCPATSAPKEHGNNAGRGILRFAQDGFYHIYNRGAAHQVIFREDENYLFVLRQVKKYARELNVAVIAYCLLPNHYHFFLRQDGQQPAGLLPQLVFNSYTKAFNKRYERSGTLLEGRYKAIPVDKEGYLLHLCRYIHANPMRHGLASQLEEWPYSNYPEWMGLRDGSSGGSGVRASLFPNRSGVRTIRVEICSRPRRAAGRVAVLSADVGCLTQADR